MGLKTGCVFQARECATNGQSVLQVRLAVVVSLYMPELNNLGKKVPQWLTNSLLKDMHHAKTQATNY
jgi:hypothetical protein